MTDRALVAAQTELTQMRLLHDYDDEDIVRLALAGWAAAREMGHGEILRSLPDWAGRCVHGRMARAEARKSFGNVRWRRGMSAHWAADVGDTWRTIDPDRVAQLATEAMIWEFRGAVLLEVARRARKEKAR